MKRTNLFYTFFIFFAVVFIARLFYIQIIDKENRLSALNNVIRKDIAYPGRGFIYDRYGKLMVGNQPAYDIMVVPAKVELADTSAFCELMGINRSQYDQKMQRVKNYSRYKPSIFIKQISKEHYAYVQEALHHYRGFYAQKRILRSYPYPTAANVVGYIGEASPRFIKNNPRYRSGDLIGKSGVELSYEELLRGKPGVKYNLVDVHNRVKGSYENGRFDTLPQPGSDLTSALDIELQEYGERLMQNKRGSMVAIEPESGEILALVTSPSYDPRLLIGNERTENYHRLLTDSFNLPLFDRALLAQYPPGSPFKVVNALIGLQEGTLTVNTTHTCNHGFHYGSLHVACHCNTFSPIALQKAISKSCNNYFCRTYKGIIENYPSAQKGMDAWSQHVKSFGLGKFLDNDLPTGRKGFVPDANYFDNVFKYPTWKAVSTISLAIGQGELLLTPIQMANMTAAIANRGYYYTPHIVKAIEGKPITIKKFTKRRNTTIDSTHFKPIVEAMRDVYKIGTARWSAHDSIPMCGKTGTAQNPHGQDHSIFIAFAPKENPKIAISVVVENGYWGSRWAAPMASLMMEKYLTREIDNKRMEKRMLEGDLREQYIEEYKAKKERQRLWREQQKKEQEALKAKAKREAEKNETAENEE